MRSIGKEFKKIVLSDKIMLNYLNVNSLDNRVNLHYYNRSYNNSDHNLGDYLSEVVVEYFLEKKGLSLSSKVEEKKHLYAIGSILLMGYQDATIWGSGLPFAPSWLRSIPHKKVFRKLDIRCVRGPLTQKRLAALGHKCPDVYGDPAVLMPLIYNPQAVKKTQEFVIIPHFSQEANLRKKYSDACVVSMRTSDYESVIDSICSAKKVVSSSLHGIILAESYGVPAVYYSDRPELYNFKYEDWYASTDREFCVRGIDSAIECIAPSVPDITHLQQNLINSFPYDLWSE